MNGESEVFSLDQDWLGCSGTAVDSGAVMSAGTAGALRGSLGTNRAGEITRQYFASHAFSRSCTGRSFSGGKLLARYWD
jgi:hypothetical protein